MACSAMASLWLPRAFVTTTGLSMASRESSGPTPTAVV